MIPTLPRLPIAVLATLILPLSLQAAPAWWSQRGVITTNTPADYAAINQGQLKNLATAAAAELDADLPNAVGGAGATIHSLLASWVFPTTRTADYASVNLGQLKSLAKPFYDQLIAVNYTNAYPWNSSAPANSADFAMANIGQVKNLFSFDLLSIDAAHDTNNDGIPDWWERFYGITNANALAVRGDGLSNLQAWQQGLNPNDFYNGVTPLLTVVSGNGQTGPVNGLLPQAMIVSLSGSNGTPLINAPVSFSTTGGTLQASSIGTPATTISTRTDGSGQAKAFLTLPNTASANVTITARAGLVPHSASTNFTEVSDNGGGTGSYDSPFAPSQVNATMNPDGSVDVTWVNNADPADTNAIDITYQDRNGNWVTATSVPAGSSSTHIPPQ